MTPWTGKLYVYQDERAQEYVSAANPSAQGIDKSKIRAFQVQGPFVPVGWPKPVPVPNANQWLDELRKRGFAVDPCSVD